MKKIRIYQTIAIAIPFVFFILFEAGLRFLNYGQVVTLFIENPAAPQYLLPRPDVVKRYFPQGSAAPSVTIETNFFLKDKPKDGIRIIVQGGSTAAGFPFGYGASIAGMLDYRLKQSFPDRPVEVINTALAAVNSYTVLDFVDEIIEQQPDAVLIYAGHNEYLGILGVGSAYTAANSSSATLLYLKLKNLRIFQLLQNLYWQFTKSDIPDNGQTSRTFMAKVAKHKNIPFGSELYQQGLAQFDTNMSLVLAKYQAADIPVFLSSIASNLANQAPFSSIELPIAVNNQQANELIKLAQKHASADLYYQAGQAFEKSQQYQKAKEAFILARDYDLLRFRAPSEINNIINKLAMNETVYFVDSNKALSASTQYGIIDNSLMLEHLHPTIKGYFIIADSFYQALKSSKLLGEFPVIIPTVMAQKDLPLFDAEIYWGKAKIAGLMADYPFSKHPQKPKLPKVINWSDKLGLDAYKKQASWLTIATENLKRSKGKNKITYLKSVKLLADAMPFNFQHNYQAGIDLIKFKHFDQALRYLKRAITHDPKNINCRLALSHAYLEQGKLKQALPWLTSVLAIDPKNVTAKAILPKVTARMAQLKTN